MQTNNFEKVLANFALLLIPATVVGKALVVAEPKPNCCRMYNGESFSGDFHDYCYDVKENEKNGQKTIDNDTITAVPIGKFFNKSYWCGQSVSYSFCYDGAKDCSGLDGASGAGNIKENFDWAGSQYVYARVLKLSHYDAKERGAVTLFANKGCAGQSGAFFATQEPTEEAMYNVKDLIKGHIAENTVSSVMVPYGYSVKLFENDGFQGESVIIDGGLYTTPD